jgi:YHS domain-containing protein
MVKTLQQLFTGLVLVLIATTGHAFAEAHNLDANGVAIKGYDPVAYFTQEKAVKGDASITSEYNGATYYFASNDHKATFDNNPAQYVPAYGGHCAFGASQGYLVDIEPDKFKVVDGKLYLNFNTRAQKLWLQDTPGHIKRANTNWPNLKS